jgi:putative DNA primase/helicase
MTQKAVRMTFSSHDHARDIIMDTKVIPFESIPHLQVLKRLTNQIKRKDFRTLAQIESDEKLQRKHYIVYAVAEILLTAKHQGWRLCRHNDLVYVFNGAFWKVIDRDLLQNFFGEAAEEMGIPKVDAMFYQFRNDLLKQFEITAYLPAPIRKEGLLLVNFINGTLEIESGKIQLRSPSSDDFLTYQLPFAYDEKALAPLFMKYLNEVLPDVESQKVLQEYMGSLFVSPKVLKLEKVLMLYGGGGNGKSVFMEVIAAMLGEENISKYSLESITSPNSYSRAELVNKLLNISTEISGKMDNALFKQLASGESVEARHIYGKPFTMDNYAKLMFSANKLPSDTEQTDGFYRRWLVVPFDQKITDDMKDVNLHRKIIDSELGGVFNWVLVGLRRLLVQKDFTKSAVVKRSVEDFRKQADSVALFLEEEGYTPDLNDWKPLKDLYNAYKLFCVDNGYKVCSNNTLSQRLRILGYELKRTNQGNIVYCKKQ